MANIIVLDPGHGGVDPGAIGNGIQEKDLTLGIALRTAAFLRGYGADVRLTRTADRVFSNDKRADLHARVSFANNINASYFISLHINSGGGTGFESYIAERGASEETGRRREIVHRQVKAVFTGEGLPDRGMKAANFAVLRETRMPSVLLEYGFIDKEKDASLLKDALFLDRLARATAEGIARAIGVNFFKK
ncbi:N-acetylmuramoyl-L-alanine amidase family protein [Aneurinibacillus tyrosinisolvens]|uniref:N-acetylmuramoyl-L-alanine amidase family protein n=1 Tax=Aneurinibacillus tyrosinisolvens TaxID=1443435 RepID=UPI00063EF180|nr:N-acetylmuramoyl-L-alanine amidase [Aneurinibacillus tyrosinisolvens]